ncbi:M20/M25/M40 family metallo-hydrolase [Phenylobacterium sp.]|uniref:M20/M25/M40 family metallo-hydrolase n=1 Tax=Phenylobacterium sp. TaxID=1871053 RepID=UPI0035AEE211
MERTLALAASLILAAILAWFQELPPHPLHANAPASQFSAGRAMADVRAMGARPHTVASPADAEVRAYLVRRMEALGLSPRIQRGVAFEQRARRGYASAEGAPVQNVVGVLPGRDRSAPAVALMAHYDTVPASPGAADDTTGVASALEIVRALKARGTPARDVVVLITDGEEAGLLGARAFFASDPLAKHIGFILNMESRGGGGRVQMFQTGARNGETVDLFRRSAARPESSSLAVFLYEHMPNDTDFTVSRAAGIAGLNYAFIGRQFDYHSPTATPDNLERRTVQDMGRQVLAAAAEAANAPSLPAPAPNKVYAQVPLGGVIAYPQTAGWLVLAAAAALILVGLARARRRQALAWRDLAQGVGAAVYLVSTSAVLLRLARRATGVDFGFLEQRRLLAEVTRFETAIVFIGVGAALYAAAALARGGARRPAAALALGAGVLCTAFGAVDPIGLGLGLVGALSAFAVFGRPAGTPGAWAGVLLTGLAAAAGLQAAAPETAFLIAWPLVLAGLAAAVSALGSARSLPVTIAIVVIAIPGLAWIGDFAHGLFLGLDMPELLAVTAWLAAFLIWPLAHPRIGGAGRVTAVAVLSLGFLLIVYVRFTPPWTERHPQASIVAYQVDADAARAYRISATPELARWSRAVLRADGGAVARRALPALWRKPVDAAPAASVAAEPARLDLAQRPDGVRELKAVAPAGAQILALRLKTSAPLADVRLNGQPAKILEKAGDEADIRWWGPPEDLVVTFRSGGSGALQAGHAAVIRRWPAAAKPLPARPRDVMAFDLSDSTIVTGSARLSW